MRTSGAVLRIETERFGLPAFKILGASWAIYRELCRRLPGLEHRWQTLEDLREAILPLGEVTFVAATDGKPSRRVVASAIDALDLLMREHVRTRPRGCDRSDRWDRH